jgi:RNA 2',3'-cyclic 3'-phosphodiesterase
VRLFLAVDLDPAIRVAVEEVAQTVHDRLGVALGRHGHRGLTWVSPGNLHMTLRFLGEVDEDTAARVRSVLAPPLTVPRFDVELAGAGMFPPAGSPRVVWLGVTAGAPGLTAVHDAIEARLQTIRFPAEDRPYRPHLTIGRFRQPGPPAVRQVVAEISAGVIARWTVDHVTLYESRLSPRGPTYFAVQQTDVG